MTVVTTPPVSDPAAAVAAARCYLVRISAETRTAIGKRFSEAIDGGHPRPCGFCDYPLEVLAGYGRQFLAWAADVRGDWIEPSVMAFHSLPRREQRRLVYLAQYDEEPMAADGSVQQRVEA